MGYCGPMGYGMQFPVNQVGGQQLGLWDIRGHELSGIWVKRGPTVLTHDPDMQLGEAVHAAPLTCLST